jgi:hypothetical protein
MTMRRTALAVGVGVVIYALAVGAGSVLYATGAIATGATHNDCADYRHEVAEERGINDEDVPQSEIKARTQTCLASHELTERHAFRSEYLFWSIWPAVICAAVFLIWPAWAHALERQETSDVVRDASHLESGA